MSMSITEIICQLESLTEHCESMIDKGDPENIWRDDVEVLREVVKKLKGELSGENAATIIRQIMEREDVNQKELAEKMGCVRQNVSQALNRGTVNMRYDSFYRMAKVLASVGEWYPIAWASIPTSSIEPSEHNNMPKV